MEKVASNAALGDFRFNPNNSWSWIDLGTVRSQSGQMTEAIAYWKTAVCMWPRGGKLYASRILDPGSTSARTGIEKHDIYEFWQSVKDANIKNWCLELAVDLDESALSG